MKHTCSFAVCLASLAGLAVLAALGFGLLATPRPLPLPAAPRPLLLPRRLRPPRIPYPPPGHKALTRWLCPVKRPGRWAGTG